MKNCDFCAIVRGEQSARIVYQNADVMAFFPLQPATLGHTLLIPKHHYADIWSIDPADATKVFSSALKLAQALRKALKPEGLNLINSAGVAATQTVFHFHLHLVPRWTNDHVGPIWPRGNIFAEAVKDDIADLVRESCLDVSP